ncbi:MAG: DUF1367 family protein [bacterium]|nr:DUF1367 family protein [bacterium]
MTEAFFMKVNGALYPSSEKDRELLSKIRTGEAVKLTYKRVRNYEFLKKWWALITFAFDCWEPPENHVGEKNLERFRKDIIILAGFYDQTIRLDGATRVEAKSISFGSMSEDDFDELYSKTIDVILKYVLKNYTGDELRSVVDQTMGFA